MLKRFLKAGCGLVLLFLVTLMYVSCGSKEEFTQQATTQFFTQDYNPPFLDVLWMIDDRSPMYRAKDHLVSEARNFFSRLDALTADYQMAFVSADMQYARGQLKPKDNPIILTKSLGTVDQRVSLFGDIISQIINLRTGYEDEGFESARTALTSYFQTRRGVPLVLVFISDSDDHSPLASQTSAVDFYANAFLTMKDNRPELLRVYSVNYEAGTPSDQNRCATRYNADIDASGFQDRYFGLARKLGGVQASAATGDLCGSFSQQIDLTGLRLKQLASRFLLLKAPRPETIVVGITRDGQSFDQKWSFDESTNEVVFDTAPPEGVTIQISYFPK